MRHTHLPRYAIQVVEASGDVVYLRHGADGGAVVQFRNRKTADINLDFVRAGLEQGEVAAVVRYRKDMDGL